MRKFQIEIKGSKAHFFNSVSSTYQWVCENVMNEGDIDWYKECGNDVPLWNIKEEKIQEAVLRNCFEKIIYSAWNDNAESWKDLAIFHE